MKGGLFPYLGFNGNCREALLFYQHCLGGRVSFQTVGDTPAAADLPVKMKECILQGTLTHHRLVLIGTDLLGDEGLTRGNAASLMLHCETRRELRTRFKKLAAGGRALQLPAPTADGALFGSLTDKYGNHWLLHVAGNA